MERSEMQIEICKLLEEQSHQGTAYMYKAQKILDLIQNLGMLPPTRYWEGTPPLTLEMPVKSNTWDPEDK